MISLNACAVPENCRRAPRQTQPSPAVNGGDRVAERHSGGRLKDSVTDGN